MTVRIEPGLGERPWKGVSFLVTEPAGVAIDADGDVQIPYRWSDGSPHRTRFYAPDGATWWSDGTGLIPFGLDTLPEASKAERSALFVTEGESDCLALREAFAGAVGDWHVDAYFAIALPGARTWRSDWRRYLEPFPVIYLVGDGDDAGRAMNARIKKDAAWARSVWLPEGEDVRSILQAQGARALDPLLEQADSDARLLAAFLAAKTIEQCERLLRGEEVPDLAA